MLEIVKNTIDFYTKYLKEPSIGDLKITHSEALGKKGACFVTIYKNGEIRGSAGNIKEIEENLALEIIKNTVNAISKDKRFAPLTLAELKDIRIRLDILSEKKILEEGKLVTLDPMKSGAIAIKKDYSSLAVVLPNIGAKLMTGEDLKDALEAKLGQKLEEKDFIIYEIHTQAERNY